mgnify:CR=1 FL=1
MLGASGGENPQVKMISRQSAVSKSGRDEPLDFVRPTVDHATESLHRHGVLVDTVEAALRDEPAREDPLVFIWRDRGHLAVGVPGLDECLPKLAASLNEARARAHRRVSDL